MTQSDSIPFTTAALTAERIEPGLTLPDADRLEFTDRFTVEAWFHADDTRREGLQSLVSKWRPPDD